MPYAFDDEERLIEETVGRFARETITLEGAADMDRHDRFPVDVIKEAAALGLTGLTVAAGEGGAGTTPTQYALAIEALATVCPNTAAVLAVHNSSLLLARSVGLQAMLATEEAHGSDRRRVGTVALQDGDDWAITGQKIWGVGAAGAETLLVLAQAPEGPTWFALPAKTKGVSMGRNEPLLGLRGSGIRTVYLDGAPARRIGEPGQGLLEAERVRPWLQVGAAAALVGAVGGAAAAANAFARDRRQFGKPIGFHQAVTDHITEIDVKRRAARALVLEAAATLGTKEAPAQAARAKTFAIGMAIDATRRAIRVQGGTGFMREGGTERFARDVRALQFLGETEQMHRDLLKRVVLDVEFPPEP